MNTPDNTLPAQPAAEQVEQQQQDITLEVQDVEHTSNIEVKGS